MANYVPCPVCGVWHDDGAFIKDPETGRYIFVCMDCGDNLSNEEIIKAIQERRKNSGPVKN